MKSVRTLRVVSSPIVLASLLALAVPSRLVAQTVHYVGSGGFGSVAEAVLAASDGDLVLVADGYTNFDFIHLDGKGLTIVSEGRSTLRTLALSAEPETLIVRNLAADQRVVVRGLELTTTNTDPETAVLVEDCAGPVVLEDCDVHPNNGIGLHARNATSVTAHGCVLSGGFGQFAVTGLRVDDSRVFLHGCEVLGGDGNDAFQDFFFPVTPNGDGGDGAWIFGASEVFASGGSIRGGDGGSPATFCFPGGDAGSGVRLGNGSDAPLLRTRDVDIGPGATTPGTCGQPAGLPGVSEIAQSGAHVTLTGNAHDMTMSAPVVAGDDVTLTFHGEPGEALVLLLSPDVMPGHYFPASELVLHLALPFADVPLGVLPASGELDLVVSVPSVPAGLDGVTLAAQALFASGGTRRLGGPSVGLFLAP
ncbi:MAG: right-handed parallel beta-helix repeat-containing protein [Planctomycetes bacterium]|nr:right-handed parallel beta-helix repeat-containing protein [Planctomycetota bacterium]